MEGGRYKTETHLEMKIFGEIVRLHPNLYQKNSE